MIYYLEVLAPWIGIYAILAMALNIIAGLTGLLNLGQAGFYAIGAYSTAFYCNAFWMPSLGPTNYIICLLFAVIVTGCFAVLIGLPCLRLRGDYLAIATLAFGEIVRLCLENFNFRFKLGEKEVAFLGGPSGLSIDKSLKFAEWWVIWLFVIAVFIILLFIKKSAIGRAFLAIRQDEIAAKSMGINLAYYKTLSFTLCAMFAALAGFLLVFKNPFIKPSDFMLFTSVEVLLFVVLGGLGSFSGSIFAAIIVLFLKDKLTEIPVLGPHKELIFALILVLSVRFIPNGFFGLKETPGFIPWLKKKFFTKKTEVKS